MEAAGIKVLQSIGTVYQSSRSHVSEDWNVYQQCLHKVSSYYVILKLMANSSSGGGSSSSSSSISSSSSGRYNASLDP